MKNRILTIICYVFALTVILTACSSSENSAPLSLDSKYVNQQIQIKVLNFGNTFTTTDSLSLKIEYNSRNEIVFPNNYGLRIFEKTRDGWQEIKEMPTQRIPSGNIVLSPDVDISAVDIVSLFPDLTNINKNTKLCIYVIGQMTENGETKSVAAFTTVVLHP